MGFSLISLASAFTIQNRHVAPAVILYSSTSPESSPCWQDIYDADCTMDSFSARFVASDWIKQLPCAQGLEECDFPEDTQLPGIRAPPVDITNMMDFLNIKRVDDTI